MLIIFVNLCSYSPPFQNENDRHLKTNLDALNKAKLKYYDQQIQNAAKIREKQQQAQKSQQQQNAKDGEAPPKGDEDETEEFDVEKYQPGE